MKRLISNVRRAATGHDIRSVLGFVDDEIVMALRDANATVNEILAAVERLEDDEHGQGWHKTDTNNKVSYLYALLRDAEELFERRKATQRHLSSAEIDRRTRAA
ncbi:MAG: hypothetical protein PHY92_10775 [Alphaproteobacteria bacterium]|nr:hypothetical protein [Alphaproteobacteria bacterium]